MRTPIRPHDLIACPRCHARMDQRCRTLDGRPRKDHSNRLVRRVCPCGASLVPGHSICGPCRTRNLRVRKRLQRRRARARATARRRLARLVTAA